MYALLTFRSILYFSNPTKEVGVLSSLQGCSKAFGQIRTDPQALLEEPKNMITILPVNILFEDKYAPSIPIIC
jgi:hypothetical protein